MNKRKVGSDHENVAAAYLEKQGLRVIDRNFRCRLGEIDLICRQEEYFVFVEVKFRSNDDKGMPQEAVGYAKQKKICKVADYYRLTHGLGESTAVRYDVVAVKGEQIEWIPNAFPHRY